MHCCVKPWWRFLYLGKQRVRPSESGMHYDLCLVEQMIIYPGCTDYWKMVMRPSDIVLLGWGASSSVRVIVAFQNSMLTSD